MYRILNFYAIVFSEVQKINSEIVKPEMMMLTEKEETDMIVD
jgi:hypothetical protein